MLQTAWAGLLASLMTLPAGSAAATPAVAQRLTSVFRRPDSARAVGHAVLEAHPELADPEALIDALTARHPFLRDPLAQGDAPALAAGLSRAVRDDFAAGRTLLVRGWLLGRAEAELCALALLT